MQFDKELQSRINALADAMARARFVLERYPELTDERGDWPRQVVQASLYMAEAAGMQNGMTPDPTDRSGWRTVPMEELRSDFVETDHAEALQRLDIVERWIGHSGMRMLQLPKPDSWYTWEWFWPDFESACKRAWHCIADYLRLGPDDRIHERLSELSFAMRQFRIPSRPSRFDWTEPYQQALAAVHGRRMVRVGAWESPSAGVLVQRITLLLHTEYLPCHCRGHGRELSFVKLLTEDERELWEGIDDEDRGPEYYDLKKCQEQYTKTAEKFPFPDLHQWHRVWDLMLKEIPAAKENTRPEYLKYVRVPSPRALGFQPAVCAVEPIAGNHPSTAKTDNSPIPPANGSPQVFIAGEMVFHADHVEICGASFCRGPRSKSRRIVLELLSGRRGDSFIAFSGDDLEAAAKEYGARGTAAGWIRDLRDDIQEALRAQSNITSTREDVILSGDSGYRFAETLTVRFADPPTITDITDITDTADAEDVPNRDVPNVPDDEAAVRQAWILEQLANGVELKASAVAAHFGRGIKTAYRDLGVLREAEKIEFVGDPRTGYYRLRRPTNANKKSGGDS